MDKVEGVATVGRTALHVVVSEASSQLRNLEEHVLPSEPVNMNAAMRSIHEERVEDLRLALAWCHEALESSS